MRSILLTKQMRGTRYLSAWRQTVSDCGCTPATESNTQTAPSRTRKERSTSTVKSTWPGVSIILTRYFLLMRRSEERRLGKECTSRWSPYQLKKKEENYTTAG